MDAIATHAAVKPETPAIIEEPRCLTWHDYHERRNRLAHALARLGLRAGEHVIVYAPNSTVTLRNNVRLTGAIAARQLVLQNNASLTYHERIADITSGSLLRLYRTAEYRECSNDQATSAIDSGC